MKNFAQWLEEKKKGKKESLPPTVVSSPLRGQNQDQSGFNTHSNVTDYTISDEKINELSPETLKSYKEKSAFSKDKSPLQSYNRLVGNARATRRLNKINIKEVIAGVGDIRSTPGNMMKTSNADTKNAPSSASHLQTAADKRRMQLDKLAQKQRDHQEKEREMQQKQREKAQSLRDKMSKVQMKASS